MEDTKSIMLPSEVAALFRVNPKTVSRWSRSGKLPCFFTVGGHRRYHRDDVMAAYENGTNASSST